MSQYPGYPPPNPQFGYPQWPQKDPRGPAKRASVMLWVIGGLITVYSMCNGISAYSLSPEMIMSNPLIRGQQELPLSPEKIQLFAIVFSLIATLFGVALAALGFPVRSGSASATTVAIVLVCLALLPAGLMVLVSLVAAIASPPMMLAGCFFLFPLVLLVVQLIWLIQAARKLKEVAAMRQIYSGQWMPQMMPPPVAPATYGYGYGHVPPQQQPISPPAPPSPKQENQQAPPS